jgi:hypothetical protein
MFCNHCGKTVIEDSLYCPHCGNEIGNNKPFQEENKPLQEERKHGKLTQTSRNTFGNAGFALSLIGFLLFLGIYLGCKLINGFPCDSWYYYIVMVFLVFGIILSLTGLIIGFIKKKAIRKSIAGLIISIIFLIVIAILVVFI